MIPTWLYAVLAAAVEVTGFVVLLALLSALGLWCVTRALKTDKPLWGTFLQFMWWRFNPKKVAHPDVAPWQQRAVAAEHRAEQAEALLDRVRELYVNLHKESPGHIAVVIMHKHLRGLVSELPAPECFSCEGKWGRASEGGCYMCGRTEKALAAIGEAGRG